MYDSVICDKEGNAYHPLTYVKFEEELNVVILYPGGREVEL